MGIFIPKSNRKASWIKIVEAFFAILLIVGVLLFLISKGYIGKTNNEEKVYRIENSILREIELDDDLRGDVLETTIPGDGQPASPSQKVKAKIEKRKPDYLTCASSVCDPQSACGLPSGEGYPPDKEVYAQSVLITATLDKGYNPKKLKLFCWFK